MYRFASTLPLLLFSTFFCFFLHGEASLDDNAPEFPQTPLASLYGFPETNIHGVNVINGDYNYTVVDIHLPGSDPLILQRSYSTSSTERRALFEGWTHNLCATIKVLDNKHKHHVRVACLGSISGEIPYSARRFQSRKNRIHAFQIEDKILEKGITNTGKGEISGRTNVKNSTLDLRKKLPSFISQINGDGSKHTYERETLFEDDEPVCYNLIKSQKPNGCTVNYHTTDFFLRKISHHDLQGNLTQMLSSNMADTPTIEAKEEGKRRIQFDIFSEDGRRVTYYFQPYRFHHDKEKTRFTLLEKIQSTHTPNEHYLYTDQKGKIQKKLKERRGDSHRIQIRYFNDGDIAYKNENSNVKVSKKHIAFGRVKDVQVAVNDPEKLNQLCRFTYTEDKKKKEAFTDAYDSKNRLTRYLYSTEDFRLRSIFHFDGSNVYKITRKDQVFWGASGSPNDSNLITRTISDGQGKIHFSENYQYDLRGNPIRKEYRFLRASSLEEYPMTQHGDKVSGGEVIFFQTEYNDSNLPTRVFDGRLHTELSYLPTPSDRIVETKDHKYSTTPLVTKRVVKEGHKILKREFYEYDQSAAPITYVVDDGSGNTLNDLTGVHQRRIHRCINKTGIFAGLPLVVKSLGWDPVTQQERLIEKTEFEYDNHSHIVSEKHYDSCDELAYIIHKSHDIQGNTLYETDPLGQVTTRVFDKYRCLLKEQGPSQTFYTEYTYDLLQRPVQTTQVYADGLRLTTRTKYDLEGNPIEDVGIYGQTTIKKYNNQKLLQTIVEPPVRTNRNEWRSPETHYTYDMMGNTATETNLSGSQTVYEHTTLGKPLLIRHPDGRTEQFKYSNFGELIEKIAPNGTKTLYTYDSLGHVLSETLFDCEGNQLRSHQFTYNGSNLVMEEEGLLKTTYAYDYVGRLIQKCVGNGMIQYSYDTLGRQCEEKVFYGTGSEEYISTIKKYDLLDRVVEEKKVDGTGKVHLCTLQSYDELGNITSTTINNHAGTATTVKKYDDRGQLTSVTDPLGNTTHYIYKYDYLFEGQTVPYQETIDPLGVRKITLSDYEGRTINEKTYSPYAELLLEEDFFYDVFGNLVRKEHLLPNETITTLYEYDVCHRLICQINGAGTAEQLTTSFVYNSFGELSETIYSDGTSKYHQYDPLGRLEEEWAHDHSIHYSYTYNENDLPIKIENLATGASTLREYSPEGNLLSEKFENGLQVRYRYDRINRALEYYCPNGSSIRKTYNPVFLEKTERLKNGVVIYEARFEEFDLTGTPQKIQFPKNSGTLSLEYDLLNRPISVISTHYKEKEISYDPRGLLVSKIVNGDLETFDHDFLGQLTLEKTPQYSHSYKNDALCRQTTVDGFSQVHNAVHQLTQGAHGEYIYDSKGRRIRDTAIQYIYDRFDRLKQINRSNETWDFTYDSFHRKMSRSKNGELSYFIYDGSEEIGSYDTDFNPIDLKVLSAGEGSIPIAIELLESTFAPLISSQGHIVGLVNVEEGDLADEHPLTMFGKDLSESPLSPWRFCGKRHESPILGIVDFGFRYYHPKSAQWMTRDPIEEGDGPNLYAYVHNNPTRCIDRYGLFSISWGFNSNDSGYDFKNLLKGITHGVVNFASENIWDLQRAAFYIGCDQTEFEFNERNELTSQFNKMEAEQKESFDNTVKRMLAVHEPDEFYERIRYWTTTGLQVGTCAYGGIKSVKALCNIGKNLYNARKLAPTLQKITPSPRPIPPTDKIWTSTKKRTRVKNAYEHWKDHKRDFPELQNAKQYVDKARNFLSKPDPNKLIKKRINGDIIIYDPTTNIFAIQDIDGIPRTMYKPDVKLHPHKTNLEYFNAQK